MHGKTSPIEHDRQGVYAGIANPCEVGRYHSLIAERESLPAELRVTARTAEGEIMGLRHVELNLEGVQFHPESVLTPAGPEMMKNFLGVSGGRRAAPSAS
jgi:anthranilate/para-aminobenzoate synthase component II